ncbi:MAG: NAD(+)/NADH kinase [bacterium]
MKRIGVTANCGKPRAAEVLKHLADVAGKHGLELIADETAAGLLNCKSVPFDKLCDQVDALMALGGDGTMLKAVRELNGRDKPVIGVNIGGLGFLTTVAEEELDQALDCLASGKFSTSIRAVAEARLVRNNVEISTYRGLNDVVIHRGPSGRIVTLDVAIENETGTSYLCDGLIVSTPTGSTGHSLSAGGPIITPDTSAFVISLICPHTLSSRPMVVPDQSRISITASKSSGDLLLSVDGQVGEPLLTGDCVTVRRSDKGVRFIHLPGYSYFSVLRQKLHWRGSAK